MPYPFEPNLEVMSPENLRKFLEQARDSNSRDRNDLASPETNIPPEETNCSEGWRERGNRHQLSTKTL